MSMVTAPAAALPSIIRSSSACDGARTEATPPLTLTLSDVPPDAGTETVSDAAAPSSYGTGAGGATGSGRRVTVCSVPPCPICAKRRVTASPFQVIKL